MSIWRHCRWATDLLLGCNVALRWIPKMMFMLHSSSKNCATKTKLERYFSKLRIMQQLQTIAWVKIDNLPWNVNNALSVDWLRIYGHSIWKNITIIKQMRQSKCDQTPWTVSRPTITSERGLLYFVEGSYMKYMRQFLVWALWTCLEHGNDKWRSVRVHFFPSRY